MLCLIIHRVWKGETYMNNKQIKLDRLTCTDGMALTDRSYNITIGLVLLWGFLLNVITARLLTPHILRINQWVVLIGYFVISFGCMALIFKSHRPAVSFLGFTGLAFAMGVLLTFFLTAYSNSSVYTAFLTTGIIVVSMMIAAIFFPAFFLSLGRVLGVCLIAAIVIELIFGLIFRVPLNILDYVIVAVFAGYVGYDWAKAQSYPKTLDNAIDSAADIYVDVVNIFIRILSIVGRSDN